MSLSGPIMAKAELLPKQFLEEGQKFKACSDWLHKFKTWFGIHQLTLTGEKLLADEEAATLLADELKMVIEEGHYSLDQI